MTLNVAVVAYIKAISRYLSEETGKGHEEIQSG
jgi:hypothetical protein